MSLVSLKLNDYLEKAGIDETKKLISSFFCSRDEDVENFMNQKAITYEYSEISRTTLICWLDEENLKIELLAYYSLAMETFVLDGLSKTLQKKIRGNDRDPRKKSNSIPAILIGQLGKNDKATYVVNSNTLFNELFLSINSINHMIASKLVYLHCKDNPKLKSLYESKGFQLLKSSNGEPVTHENGESEYLIYIMSMKEMKRILSENKLI